MHLVLLLAAAALLGSCHTAYLNKQNKMKMLKDIDNSIGNRVQTKSQGFRDYLWLTDVPLPAYAHKPGTALELTCKASGSPAPSIHWFKNDVPIFEHDAESTEVIKSSPTSVARVSSTLIVTQTKHRDEYTCLATTRAQTFARSTTVVYSTDGTADVSERSKLNPLAPRIVVTYATYVDNIGNKAVLPCRVKGHPKPKVTWYNNENRTIEAEPRMKVLRSGELVISSLLWSDMGDFTCKAENSFGSVTARTFIYPAKAE